ncbi:DMT family transporter [Anderseniella sp. Alg231-50]|uniref:DMT family transporter n=1 Tax=Anderseniella sp. Alg231-50 TaxID=1922226 RepID=UPI00307C2785
MTTSSVTSRPDNPVTGACLIVFAVFLMALQDAVIKYASSDLTLWQLYVLRSLLALPVLAVIAGLKRTTPAVLASAAARWVTLRSCLLVLMYVSLYAAIPVLPLSTLAAGFYTGPLFIAILSAVLIGEPVSTRGWLAVATGFSGVLLIIRPGTDEFSLLVLLPVLSGLFYALAAILTRDRCQHDTPVALAISLNLVLLITGAAVSVVLFAWQPSGTVLPPFLSGPWAAMTLREWGLVMVLAVLIVGIGVGLAAAYQAARPVIVATFDYSYLIFSTMFGFLLFAETPDLATVTGMGLIAGAGLIVVRS